MTDAERNFKWLSVMKPTVRAFVANYNVTSQTPDMRYKLVYGPKVTTNIHVPVRPSSQAMSLFNQMAVFHANMMPGHGFVLLANTIYEPVENRTIFYHPNGNVLWANDIPAPYDLPPIQPPLPPTCYPCIEPIMIARGPAV